MDLPEVVVFDGPSEDDAAEALARHVAGLEIGNPLVLASVHAARLTAHLPGPRAHPTTVRTADQPAAAQLGVEAQRKGADAVVAAGGGRCLDIAKLAAGRAGLPTVVVPTQLSHDGICSPVAVVPNGDGRAESIGASAPRAAFLSMPTLAGAPPATIAAGIGDLLANPLALRDWALACERGIDEPNQRAWDLSVQAFQLVEPWLDQHPEESRRDPAFLRRLADALVMSGMAMVIAGSSRPASGGEHEVSHALDELYGSRAMHGAQVAFGCVVSVHLYGENTASFRQRLQRLGLPHEPAALGLSALETATALLRAPETRPERYTILEHSQIDEVTARRLVDEIWGDVFARP